MTIQLLDPEKKPATPAIPFWATWAKTIGLLGIFVVMSLVWGMRQLYLDPNDPGQAFLVGSLIGAVFLIVAWGIWETSEARRRSQPRK